MERLQNLGLIFLSPGTVARNVAGDPHWVIPLVVVVGLSFLSAVITHRYQDQYAKQVREQILRESGVEIEDDARVGVTTRDRLVAGAAAGGGTVVVMLIAAAVLKGVASVAGGGVGFRKMLAFYAYASLIGVLGVLIKMPLVLAKGTIDVRTSVAAFFPSIPFDSPIGVLLNNFDIFSIWTVVAVVIGYHVLTEIGMKKSAAIVVALWGVVVVVGVVGALVKAALTG